MSEGHHTAIRFRDRIEHITNLELSITIFLKRIKIPLLFEIVLKDTKNLVIIDSVVRVSVNLKF